jgi:hypothetical protein
MLGHMAAWSPTLEGFRSILRRPILPLAEVAWHWSFGAAGIVLTGFLFYEYLDTLPVSRTDLVKLRSGYPLLVSNALAHILRGSGLRLVLALMLLLVALVVLWILVASIGRVATLTMVVGTIRERARIILGKDAAVTQEGFAPASEADVGLRSRFGSLAGLHFLRAVLALAACTAFLGAVIFAGFASSKTDPRSTLVFLLTLTLTLLVWLAWSSINWFLSLASIFVVGRRQDAFRALSSSVDLCRERFGPLLIVGTWFGLAHLVLFILATSVVTFPLTFSTFLPRALVLSAVLLLTLGYFAVVDWLHVARMAGYVAILEAPPKPVALASAPVLQASTQHSAISIKASTSMVDQDELILSDPTTLPVTRQRQTASPLESAQVDQEETILSDVPNETLESNSTDDLRRGR